MRKKAPRRPEHDALALARRPAAPLARSAPGTHPALLVALLGGLVVAAAITCPTRLRAQGHPPPMHTEVAEGVHLFRTAPYGEVGLDGNSVVVVGDEAVLVFDTNGTPAAAEAVLDEIRRLTDKPVRYVVLSHWHWDHWYGTDVYRRAFPDIRVIAQERSRTLMAGPAVEFNRPGIEEQIPAYISMLEARIAEEEAATPPREGLPQLRERLATARFFLRQKEGARLVLPDLTFEDDMEIDLGGRAVRVLNFGRAVTPGDALLFLPEERIVITGDLLIEPVTYALGVYPTEWLDALERVDALDATMLVPGHGAPMHDEEHLHETMEAMRILLREGASAKGRGLDADEARRVLMPRLAGVRRRITGGDPAVEEQFEALFVDWYLHRVWDELDGSLPDAIAPIPHG